MLVSCKTCPSLPKCGPWLSHTAAEALRGFSCDSISADASPEEVANPIMAFGAGRLPTFAFTESQ